MTDQIKNEQNNIEILKEKAEKIQKELKIGEKKVIFGSVKRVEMSSLNIATGKITTRTLTKKETSDYLESHKLPKVKVAKQEGGNDSTEN